ncbi:hypothetical protein LPJ53_000164 [Coemansia erecta]|uniref:DUF3533 domain-containing protein n=1 Tax=Coemansia erecta TaxID=147472 RepID=A0A9W7Y964_9FUNG|nr:hypothetical protein LPJ53_000164 [Coemansia erecta]
MIGFLWFVLALFYGKNFKRSMYAYRIDIDIINLDDGPVGQNITNTILALPKAKTSPTWRLKTDISTIDEAREYTRKYAWGALVINKGLSGNLNNSLATGSSYNSSAAITILEQEGRHPIAQLLFVKFTLEGTVGSIATQYAIQQLADYKSAIAGSDDKDVVANIEALFRPIGYTVERVGFYGFSLSAVLLPLGMMVSFVCVLVPVMMLKFGSYPAYRTTRHRSIFRFLVGVIFVLCLGFSFYATLAFLAFRGPNYNKQELGLPVTGGRFFSIWMTYLLTIFPMSLWIKSLSILIPPAFVAIPSVLTLIPNTLAGLTVAELSSNFFKWFHGLPFYQGGVLGRYVIGGGYPKLGQCLGVLFGETVFSLILLYFCTLIQQHFVHTGAVDHMGNYRGTKAYLGSAFNKTPIVDDGRAEEPSDSSIEAGKTTSRQRRVSEQIMSIVDDEEMITQAGMQNETVAL